MSPAKEKHLRMRMIRRSKKTRRAEAEIQIITEPASPTLCRPNVSRSGYFAALLLLVGFLNATGKFFRRYAPALASLLLVGIYFVGNGLYVSACSATGGGRARSRWSNVPTQPRDQ